MVGWTLKNAADASVLPVASAARLILILIPALAIILLAGLGLVARGRLRPGAWGSSNDPRECSDVTVGRRMWERIDVPPEQLLDEVVRATLLSGGNWG